MTISIQIGLDVINSYKRLAYQPWFALAEFIDNSTQAYFDHRKEIDAELKKTGEVLTVSIAYEKDSDILRIVDNSIGMNYDELKVALHVAKPPMNTKGRSKYGMGMKTAACWLGNHWTITTKKLGETDEHTVTIEVEKIAAGNAVLPHKKVSGKAKALHYTIIEISEHNRKFQGRTLGKIRDFLRSMYREDFRKGHLKLEWNGSPLTWEDLDSKLLKAKDSSLYKKPFQFKIGERQVTGWVGILDRGSRADAGFSIIHCGRVVKGWPDAWRPESLYGQLQGSNDLVNQRLVGEIHLNDFDVSHTKDDILWLGDEEDQVQDELKKYCTDYRELALKRRKGDDDERGPSDTETDAAVDEFKREIQSPEMVDKIEIEVVPPQDVVEKALERLTQAVDKREATFGADIGSVSVRGFLVSDYSVNDPYVIVDSTKHNQVLVIINTAHPHWAQLKGSEGVLNYLRHCTYDAIAEWQARHKAARLDPDTIKLLKDKLLRVPFDIEMHETSQGD